MLQQELGTCWDEIRRELLLAYRHLGAIQARMHEIEGAGMYGSVPSEQWQSRNGPERKYLYMLFTRDWVTGVYLGPGEKRKLYVGCKKERIAEARRLVANRERWEELKGVADRLETWIGWRRRALVDMADAIGEWPRIELGPGPGAAGEVLGPNDEGDVSAYLRRE